MSKLEERLRSIEASQYIVVSREEPGTAVRSDSGSDSDRQTSPPAHPSQPGEDQTQFKPVRGKRSAKRKHATPRLPLHVGDRDFTRSSPEPCAFLPAAPDLVIGASTVRNVKIPAVTVRCFPGARVGDIEGHLRLLKQAGRKYRCIAIHAGSNDARRGHTEVLKVQVAAVCELAKSISDKVIFSGPLPIGNNDETFSRLSSFNCWLHRWSTQSGIDIVDNWHAFLGKPGLIGRDGIHPTSEGASLLSRNLAARMSCDGKK